jgi:hypothetical protein
VWTEFLNMRRSRVNVKPSDPRDSISKTIGRVAGVRLRTREPLGWIRAPGKGISDRVAGVRLRTREPLGWIRAPGKGISDRVAGVRLRTPVKPMASATVE